MYSLKHRDTSGITEICFLVLLAPLILFSHPPLTPKNCVCHNIFHPKGKQYVLCIYAENSPFCCLTNLCFTYVLGNIEKKEEKKHFFRRRTFFFSVLSLSLFHFFLSTHSIQFFFFFVDNFTL